MAHNGFRGGDRTIESEAKDVRRRFDAARLMPWALLLVSVGILAYAVQRRLRENPAADEIRELFTERRYDEAREPLDRWLEREPGSGEAQYYRAWLALSDDQAPAAAEAIEAATQHGFDAERLECLRAIFESRSGQFNEAEPTIKVAFDKGMEPRSEIAKELARIYLKTFRLSQAAEPIERWKTLRPDDPLPYIWSNEIASRSEAGAGILIRNYQSALERDPNLGEAQLGLAEQLTSAGRFDEADRAYRAYLETHPRDGKALVGLGRNSFQSGEIERSIREFETALEVAPGQTDALKEIALADVRLGHFEKACRRYETLISRLPFDIDIRQAYAQALRLSGKEEQARKESDVAARLRVDYERILQISFRVLGNSEDLASRFEVAKWMLENGHENEGLKWTTEILRTHPQHGPTHGLLANYYQKAGNAGLANYHRLLESSNTNAK